MTCNRIYQKNIFTATETLEKQKIFHTLLYYMHLQ